jgi:hypothetical protein
MASAAMIITQDHRSGFRLGLLRGSLSLGDVKGLILSGVGVNNRFSFFRMPA